jgi:hypothetical protein
MLSLALLAAGCRPPPPAVSPKAYFGPTDPIDVVIRDINLNNTRVQTLWASGTFEANLVDENRKSHFVNGTVTLVHEKPSGLRVIGSKDLAGTVFDIGSNDDRYWLIVAGDVDTMWWGRYDAPRADDGDTGIPIRPELIIEVLGIGDIETNLRRDPVPVMRFNNDADAYMLVWHVSLPDRIVAQKEVWYDRQTKRPKLVLLFDEHGRVVLRAYPSRFVPLPGDDGRPDPLGPQVASVYDLFFPDTRSSLRLEFEDVLPSNDGAPSELSFRFPTPQRAKVSKIISLDGDRGS